MTVYRIKAKNGAHKCDWCGERATLRGFGWGKKACPDHADELSAWDRKAQAPDYSDAAFYGGY